nr:MAG TPA_asm: YtxH-like protein [Caudoviricetes sp.]
MNDDFLLGFLLGMLAGILFFSLLYSSKENGLRNWPRSRFLEGTQPMGVQKRKNPVIVRI